MVSLFDSTFHVCPQIEHLPLVTSAESECKCKPPHVFRPRLATPCLVASKEHQKDHRRHLDLSFLGTPQNGCSCAFVPRSDTPIRGAQTPTKRAFQPEKRHPFWAPKNDKSCYQFFPGILSRNFPELMDNGRFFRKEQSGIGDVDVLRMARCGSPRSRSWRWGRRPPRCSTGRSAGRVVSPADRPLQPRLGPPAVPFLTLFWGRVPLLK